MIVRRGGNKDGWFLEAAAYGMGERRGILLIPKGHWGWGWDKFAGELRKEKDLPFCYGGVWEWVFAFGGEGRWEGGNGALVYGCGEVGIVP